MFDALLSLLCCADWLSPLIVMMQDRRNGPYRPVFLPRQDRVGRQAEQLLRSNGIKTWGRYTAFRYEVFHVCKSEAVAAERLLLGAGFPVLNRIAPDATHTRRGGFWLLFGNGR